VFDILCVIENRGPA